MKKTPNINIIDIITRIIKRSKYAIFTVIMISGLIFCVITLNDILQIPFGVEPEKSGNVSTTQFDQATIDQLNKLKSSSDNKDVQALPVGRINPFFE